MGGIGGAAAGALERPNISIIAMAKIVPPPKAMAYLMVAGRGGMGSVDVGGTIVSSGASLFIYSVMVNWALTCFAQGSLSRFSSSAMACSMYAGQLLWASGSIQKQ